MLLALGQCGGVVGALVAPRVVRRVGSARALLLFKIGATPFGLLIPFTAPGTGLAFFVCGSVGLVAGVVAGNVVSGGFVPRYCPRHLLGRVTTSMQFVNFGSIPIGAVLGGVLASSLGFRPALWLLMGTWVLSSMILFAAPELRGRDLPVRDGATEPSEPAGRIGTRGCRRCPRRARPGAARGGRGGPRPGLHPRRRRHRQDPRDHPPHRLRGAHRRGPARQLLAVTFTARAAGELRTRLRALGAAGVQARTFHAAALRQLHYFAPRVLGGGMPDVVDNTLRLVGNAAARLRLRVDRAELRDLAAEIDWAKAILATPEDYPQRGPRGRPRAAPRPPTRSPRCTPSTRRPSGAPAQLDFADLLLIMAGAIEEHRDVAEEVRARYRHFVVDEYQDVSPLQQRLLDAWLGDRDDLCVVGDANQTIYSFAGATPEHLLGFRRRFPDAVVVRLERDYRSTPQVVELANRLVGAAAAGAHPARPAPGRPGADLRRVRRRAGRGRARRGRVPAR